MSPTFAEFIRRVECGGDVSSWVVACFVYWRGTEDGLISRALMHLDPASMAESDLALIVRAIGLMRIECDAAADFLSRAKR